MADIVRGEQGAGQDTGHDKEAEDNNDRALRSRVAGPRRVDAQGRRVDLGPAQTRAGQAPVRSSSSQHVAEKPRTVHTCFCAHVPFSSCPIPLQLISPGLAAVHVELAVEAVCETCTDDDEGRAVSVSVGAGCLAGSGRGRVARCACRMREHRGGEPPQWMADERGKHRPGRSAFSSNGSRSGRGRGRR